MARITWNSSILTKNSKNHRFLTIFGQKSGNFGIFRPDPKIGGFFLKIAKNRRQMFGSGSKIQKSKGYPLRILKNRPKSAIFGHFWRFLAIFRHFLRFFWSEGPKIIKNHEKSSWVVFDDIFWCFLGKNVKTSSMMKKTGSPTVLFSPRGLSLFHHSWWNTCFFTDLRSWEKKRSCLGSPSWSSTWTKSWYDIIHRWCNDVNIIIMMNIIPFLSSNRRSEWYLG